jgi:hypothetical protein
MAASIRRNRYFARTWKIDSSLGADGEETTAREKQNLSRTLKTRGAEGRE